MIEPQNKTAQVLHEQPLGDGLRYLKALVARYPGTIQFETGAGHIIHDLLARLPPIAQLETQKIALCNQIVEAVYPLAACLFAEGVSMTLTATSEPLAPPRIIDGLGTYSAFDAERKIMRHYFMSPPHDASYVDALTIASGLGVLCEPLNYDSQRFHENRSTLTNPSAIWEWTERTIGEWYEQKVGQSFVPVRLRVGTNSISASVLAGIVDTAAVSLLQSGVSGIASGLVSTPQATPPKTISAFAHEAGFAETAVNPRSDPRTNRSAPAQAPVTSPQTTPQTQQPQQPSQAPAQPDTANPNASVTEAQPHSPHVPHHLPHSEPEVN